MIKEIILGTGGAVLIAAIIAAVIIYRSSRKDDGEIESIYVDELNTGEIKKWFSDRLTKETLKGVVLYPTPENISKWKLPVDAAHLDNTLIQAVFDEDKDEIADYREVVFGTLSEKLKDLLDANGGAFVIDR